MGVWFSSTLKLADVVAPFRQSNKTTKWNDFIGGRTWRREPHFPSPTRPHPRVYIFGWECGYGGHSSWLRERREGLTACLSTCPPVCLVSAEFLYHTNLAYVLRGSECIPACLPACLMRTMHVRDACTACAACDGWSERYVARNRWMSVNN